ncbi:MAG TPA: hypothetical protein VF383_15890 [Candidatus Dormibacteraeota bacterium]
MAPKKKTITDEIDEATAWPIMVSDGLPWAAGPQVPGPATPSSDLGASALSAIKNVLGWAYRPGADPKTLVGALNQKFKAIPRQGRVDYEYQPSNSVAVQADLGKVTGAQASLYTRAKASLDQMMILLAGLKPLLPDPDISEIEAIRSLVRNEINDVVQQLGAEGGPNVQLVDEAFTFLGGPSWGADDISASGTSLSFRDVGGHLGALRHGFGFSNRWVNTIDEEQDLTNFIVLVDYVNTVYESWKANRKYFDGTETHAFMGTALIQVSRVLAVIAETVDEVCYVCNTVFLGPAERQTIQLTYGAGKPTIFFADLLEWVRGFAADEGRRIINESGKDGVQTFTRTARRLKQLVEGALKQEPDNDTIPDAFRTRRIQVAIGNLAGQLEMAIKEARNIKRVPPPQIYWADVEFRGSNLLIEMGGIDISQDAIVRMGFGAARLTDAAAVDANAVTANYRYVTASTLVRAGFDPLDELRKQKPKKPYTGYLIVKNDDGQIALFELRGEDNEEVVNNL